MACNVRDKKDAVRRPAIGAFRSYFVTREADDVGPIESVHAATTVASSRVRMGCGANEIVEMDNDPAQRTRQEIGRKTKVASRYGVFTVFEAKLAIPAHKRPGDGAPATGTSKDHASRGHAPRIAHPPSRRCSRFRTAFAEFLSIGSFSSR